MRNLGMAEPRASNNIIRNWFISVSWYQYLAFSLRVSPTVARWLPVHVLFFTSLSERVCFFPKRRSRIPGFLVIVLSLGQVTWFTIWATREAPRRLLVSPQNDWWLRLQRICLQCRRRVRSLGREDPVEKGTATHSNILAGRIIWREEPGRLQFMGSQRVRHDWATNTHSEFMQLHEKHYIICQVFHLLFAFVLWEPTLFPSYSILRKLFNLMCFIVLWEQ